MEISNSFIRFNPSTEIVLILLSVEWYWFIFFCISELLAKKKTPSVAINGNRVFIVFISISQRNDLFDLHDILLFNKLKRIDSTFVSIYLIQLLPLWSTCSVTKPSWSVTLLLIDFFHHLLWWDHILWLTYDLPLKGGHK